MPKKSTSKKELLSKVSQLERCNAYFEKENARQTKEILDLNQELTATRESRNRLRKRLGEDTKKLIEERDYLQTLFNECQEENERMKKQHNDDVEALQSEYNNRIVQLQVKHNKALQVVNLFLEGK